MDFDPEEVQKRLFANLSEKITKAFDLFNSTNFLYCTVLAKFQQLDPERLPLAQTVFQLGYIDYMKKVLSTVLSPKKHYQPLRNSIIDSPHLCNH